MHHAHQRLLHQHAVPQLPGAVRVGEGKLAVLLLADVGDRRHDERLREARGCGGIVAGRVRAEKMAGARLAQSRPSASCNPRLSCARSSLARRPKRRWMMVASPVAILAWIKEGRSNPASCQCWSGKSPGCRMAWRLPVIEAIITSRDRALEMSLETTTAGRRLRPDWSVKPTGTRITSPLRQLVVDRVGIRLPVTRKRGDREPAPLVPRSPADALDCGRRPRRSAATT